MSSHKNIGLIIYTYIVLVQFKSILSEGTDTSGFGLCPESCTCTSHTTGAVIVDCADRNLFAIPESLPSNTTELFLQNNLIIYVNLSAFANCSQLRVLHLEKNLIGAVYGGDGPSLENLREFYLNNNQLDTENCLTCQFPFDKIRNVEILFLHSNYNISYDGIGILKNIHKLSIHINDKVVDLGSEFKKLENLREMSIFGTFERLTNESFVHLSLSPVQMLNIKSSETLRYLEPLTFAPLSYLEVLDLGYNRRLGINSTAIAWYGLPNTKIHTLILSRILKTVTKIEYLTENFYQHIGRCNIKKLLLDKNNIGTVASGFSKAFPHLEHWDFSFNRMMDFAAIKYAIFSLNQLRFADICYQTRKFIDPKYSISGRSSSNRKRRNIFNKSVSGVSNTPYEAQIEKFNANSTVMKDQCGAFKYQPCSFWEYTKGRTLLRHVGPWCFLFPKTLEIINFTSYLNAYLNFIPQTVFILDGNTKFSQLIYSSNDVEYVFGPLMFIGVKKDLPITFDLSDNKIICLAPDAFRRVEGVGVRLEVVNLSFNNLGNQLSEDSEGKTCGQLFGVESLNLAQNNIKDLPSNVFQNNANLTHLNLSRNSLQTIRIHIEKLMNLKVLDLSENAITYLSQSSLIQFDSMIRRSENARIYLSGNPIVWSCESLSFLECISQKRRHIADFNSMTCLVDNSRLNFNRLVDVELPNLRLECSSNAILATVGGLIGVCILVLGFSIVLYRHRWDIKFCLLKSRTNASVIERKVTYKFDAFVSYDSRDIHWVRYELLRQFPDYQKIIGSETNYQVYSLSESTGVDKIKNNNANINNGNNIPMRNLGTPTNGTCNNTIRIDPGLMPLHFCLHDFNFAVGESIEENIVKAISESRRVIVVLSKHFLSSKWCNFELEVSRMESLDRGINIIVPVKLEDLNPAEMSSSLRTLLRQVTYQEWSDNPVDQQEFWRSLAEALCHSRTD